jgi:hypothetical protein
MSQTRWGHTILYGIFVGMIGLLLVTHYQDIQNTFTSAGFITNAQTQQITIPPGAANILNQAPTIR